MRFHRLSAAFIALAAVTACKGDQHPGATVNNAPPLAYVRFFNAVPDSLPFDFREIDRIQYATPFLAVPFRAEGLGNYLGYQAGANHIRIFPNSTDLVTTSTIIQDTTVTLTAGTYYTFIESGYMRSGSVPTRSLTMLTDANAVPSSGVSYRVINVGPDLGNVDVYVTTNPGDPLPATATFANVPFRGVTSPVNAGTGPMTARIFKAGTTTPVLATSTAPPGSVTTICGLTNIGGSTMAGTVMTIMVYGSAVAGSPAAVAGGSGANLTPGAVWWIDVSSQTVTVNC